MKLHEKPSPQRIMARGKLLAYLPDDEWNSITTCYPAGKSRNAALERAEKEVAAELQRRKAFRGWK